MRKEGLNMSIRGKNENTLNKINPYIYEQINNIPNKRVKRIYDQYSKGKSITIDDLKYLWLNDFEGCTKLVRNFVETKNDHGRKTESNDMENVGFEKRNTEIAKEQHNHMDSKSDTDNTIDTLKDITEIMKSIKLMRENMSESERMDMSINLFETLELNKLAKNMQNWDDAFLGKMVMYTYDEKKEFNVVV